MKSKRERCFQDLILFPRRKVRHNHVRIKAARQNSLWLGWMAALFMALDR
jgi:hypothetical protein